MESYGLENTSTAEMVIFAILAGAAVAGALFTVTRRNPVAAVMSLVATFFALAGIYATLSAHFLAVLQVLVYAGAIMVLFIFVVMILNREEVEPVSFRGIITRALGVVHLLGDGDLLPGPLDVQQTTAAAPAAAAAGGRFAATDPPSSQRRLELDVD